MSKIINDRCPLQSECERKKCDFLFKEAKCPYYYANINPDSEIEGQSTTDYFDILDDDEDKTLEYIPIDELYPHPDNPRKDLGDLTELVESIKENGVLQNLLIVPGHKQTHEEWKELAEQYEADPSEELRHRMNNKDRKDGYTVIIGHRRLAAAKEAGLTELPCVIAELDTATQISMMLLENMQRTDLSVYEQAQGIQMLLDLGDSVHDIAKKTGLSDTTIRRRTKLLDLDAEKFKKSAERGATLSDYVKLEQIEDLNLRNEVLEYLGTGDFTWKLNNAISTEKRKKTKARWIEIFNSFATQVKKKDGYKQVSFNWLGHDPDSTSFITPKDANEVAYFYYVDGNYIYLLKEKEDEASDPEAEKKVSAEEARVQRLNELKEAHKVARTTRRVFVQNYTGKKEDLPELLKFLSYTLIVGGADCDEAILAELLCVEWGEDKEYMLCDKPEYIELCEKHPYAILLHLLFEHFDHDENCYHFYHGTYEKNEGLERWYSLLEKLGYPISTEERQLLDGTHELYPNRVVD